MVLIKENQCNRYLQLVSFKIKKEIDKGGEFDTQDAESFIISYGIYDISRFNCGNKGDNFDSYMNESIKKDFLDFIRKESKRMQRIHFSLDKEVEDDKALKYEDIYNIDESDNIIDLVDNILMVIEDSVTLIEFNLITQIVEGLAYTKDSIKANGTINIRELSKEISLSEKVIKSRLKKLKELLEKDKNLLFNFIK